MVLEGNDALLVLLATFENGGTATWHGLLLRDGAVRPVGVPVAASEHGRSSTLAEPARRMVDLVVAASVSYAERFDDLAGRLDELESRAELPPVDELARLQRGLHLANKHLGRLERLLAELAGPLGTRFRGAERAVATLAGEVARTREISTAVLQAARDLGSLRAAVEANRLAAAANELGRTSNAIAALANNSNVRMLGIAYVGLVIALVSVVVLIPNTAATIFGMPSAAWVPGPYVDLTLVVLALVPFLVVFTRPWVRRMLASSRAFEARSGEGLSDLPEVSPSSTVHSGDAERLIRERP